MHGYKKMITVNDVVAQKILVWMRKLYFFCSIQNFIQLAYLKNYVKLAFSVAIKLVIYLVLSDFFHQTKLMVS